MPAVKKEFSRDDYIKSLRSIADLLENNPKMPLLYSMTSGDFIFCQDAESWHSTVNAFGSGTKDADENSLCFYPDIAPWVRVNGWKTTLCERMVIGTEIVPEEVVPATEASVVPSFERELIEWRCKPFTAAPVTAQKEEATCPL